MYVVLAQGQQPCIQSLVLIGRPARTRLSPMHAGRRRIPGPVVINTGANIARNPHLVKGFLIFLFLARCTYLYYRTRVDTAFAPIHPSHNTWVCIYLFCQQNRGRLPAFSRPREQPPSPATQSRTCACDPCWDRHPAHPRSSLPLPPLRSAEWFIRRWKQLTSREPQISQMKQLWIGVICGRLPEDMASCDPGG